MNGFVAAAAQYPVSKPASWTEIEDTLSAWVAEAAARGAQLLVFPEYASMSLPALFAPDVQADLAAQLIELQQLRDDYLALHRRLAQTHQVYLLAGSFPWQVSPGRFHNRTWLCAPSGASDYQDKQIMTRFEREQWGIQSSDELRVFDTALGCIGVNICYDVEFPLFARAQAEAGAILILTPSCTDTVAGYFRVRVGAQARALENQCYVIQSPLVGSAAWSPAVDINVGAAGFYGPPERGFPDDGVIAQGPVNEAKWVYAGIEPERVDHARREGQVLNFKHWPEQKLPPRSTLTRIDLR
ncbi:MAG: carbon-nitrogen hydrolase family protein [Gammaproteobacteria bacterium]|nr:carbon-nitrogen hydrolase family protein [Gammaproteobacteria bacterium]